MEALLFIFAEILAVCMAPFLALAGAALGALLELLAAIFGGVFALLLEGRRAKKQTPKPAEPRKPLIPRKLIHWSAGILVGVGVLGVIATMLFFQPILRHVVTTAADKAGISVSYADAEGTLITGNVALSDLRLTRDDDTGLGFDLTVDRVQADVNVWSLLSNEPLIALARVEGVTGYVSPTPRDKDKTRKERRPFRADLVQASGVDIEVRPKTSEAYTLVIPQAEVAPFRSENALFDLLFRSNMQAELAGQPLVVETRAITENGRETFWSFEDVEADKLKLLMPKAPLTWMNGGQLNIKVDDRWSLSDDWIEMDWQVGFDRVSLQVPDQAGTAEKLLGAGLAKVVNAKDGTADIRYQLSLDKQQIASLRSGNLDQFWDVVLSGFLKPGAIKASVGAKPAEDAEGAQDEDKPGVIDRLKGVFKRDKDAAE